jgi:chromosome segregation protein
MSKLSDFFSQKSREAGSGKHSRRTNGKRTNGDGDHFALENVSDVGTRIGEENESLRNLLFDTGRQIGELDDLKDAFDKLVTPFNNTLRALEQEKSQNLSLERMLAENRSAYETLQTEFYQVEKKATLFESESERLREDLELARETARGLESNRSELSNLIASQNAQIFELERQSSKETAQRRSLSENELTLTKQLDAAEKRISELEGELAAARERHTFLEDEKRSLQTAVDQSHNETARLTRRLTESENVLTATRSQLGKVEANFAEAYSERGRLAAALDEANEKHQAEHNSLNMRLDGLQSRAATAEKLLAEARQNLIARIEEVRAFDRKSVEATIARNSADKRHAEIEAMHDARERRIKELEQSRAALAERTNALTKILKARETALARAEEKIQSLTEHTGHLEADIQVSRTNIEKRAEDLNSSLQSERMERAVLEGALEAAHKDNSRLQSKVAALRSTLRRGAPLDESPPSAPDNEDAPRSRKGKCSDLVERIIKS